jgi:hypothetical protein
MNHYIPSGQQIIKDEYMIITAMTQAKRFQLFGFQRLTIIGLCVERPSLEDRFLEIHPT